MGVWLSCLESSILAFINSDPVPQLLDILSTVVFNVLYALPIATFLLINQIYSS